MATLQALALLLTMAVTGDNTQLLCFGSTWCQPCREMQPTIDRLAREGRAIRKLDIDKQPELAQRYRVSSVPTFILVDGEGRALQRIDRATSYEHLVSLFPSQSDFGERPRQQSPGSHQPTVAMGDHAFDPSDERQLAQPLPTVQARAMASTVRLRVEDDQGHSFGTGTVIDVHGKEALVLTCAHIFRDSQGKARIILDRFDSPNAIPTTGTLISEDIDLDVALVSMKLLQPITSSPLANLNYRATRGEAVFSIGCDKGAPPTVMQGNINDVDKYLGAPNLTASGEPVIGRSGGGLFNAEGLLIGVCNAADPEYNEGLYAALPRVCYELDRNGLSFVYTRQARPTTPQAELATAGDNTNPDFRTSSQLEFEAAGNPHPSSNPFAFASASESTRRRDELAPRSGAELHAAPSANLGTSRASVWPPSQAGATSQTGDQDDELMCVLRENGEQSSRVYVIKNPSRTLLEYLERESE